LEYLLLANWGTALAQEKFYEIKSPIWTMQVTQSFFSSGSGWRGHTRVKGLPQVGVEVCTKFGGDWSGSSRVKEGHWYIYMFYIERDFKLFQSFHDI